MTFSLRLLLPALVLTVSVPLVSAAAVPDNLKPRLVVCTDIGSPEVEPDDMESAVRLLAYRYFEISATSLGLGMAPTTRPASVRGRSTSSETVTPSTM